MSDPTVADFLARIDACEDPELKLKMRRFMGESLMQAPPVAVADEVEQLDVAHADGCGCVLHEAPREPRLAGGRPLPSPDLATVQEQYVNAITEIEQLTQLLSHYMNIFPNAAPGVLDRVAMLIVPLVEQIVQSMSIDADGRATMPPSLAQALLTFSRVSAAQVVALVEFSEWANQQMMNSTEYGDDKARLVLHNLRATGLVAS